MKLSAQRSGLTGNVITFNIVCFDSNSGVRYRHPWLKDRAFSRLSRKNL
jgi:hypothetical protein